MSAANRHLGRIIALQTLFEQDFRADGDSLFDLEATLQRNIARYKATIADTDFVLRLVKGVDKRVKQLDAALQPVAPEWPIDQIARMDRVVLRIGLYELWFEKDVPPKVVINEAVELAKAFGSENSSKFVNGVLGTLLRQRDEAQDADAATDKPTAAHTPPKEATTPATAPKSKPTSTAEKTPAKPKTARKPTATAAKTTVAKKAKG